MKYIIALLFGIIWPLVFLPFIFRQWLDGDNLWEATKFFFFELDVLNIF